MTDYPPPPGPNYPPNPAGGPGMPPPPGPSPAVPPYPGAPEPPAPQYQAYQPGQVPGVPQQPMYQQPVAPSGPSPFAAGLSAMWNSSLDIWRGQPEQAVGRSKEVVVRTGASWAYWLPTFLTVTVIQFVLMLLLGLSAGSGADSIVFALLTSLFSFGMLCLASLAILVAHRTVGSQATYGQSATSYALGNAFWIWGTVPVTIVLMLIRGMSLGTVWLLGLVLIYGVAIGLIGMTVIYMSAREDAPGRSSILVPLVGYISIVYGVVYLILYSILLNMVITALGDIFYPYY